MEVMNLIDDGKNPDEFTRDTLISCIARNQITKAKWMLSRLDIFFSRNFRHSIAILRKSGECILCFQGWTISLRLQLNQRQQHGILELLLLPLIPLVVVP